MCNGPVRYTSYYPPRTLINEISGNLIPLTAQRFTVVTFHRMQFVGGRPIGTTPRFLVLRRRYCQDCAIGLQRARSLHTLWKFISTLLAAGCLISRRKRLSGYFNPREKKDKIRVFWRYIYLIDLLIGEKWLYFYGVFLRDNGMIRIWLKFVFWTTRWIYWIMSFDGWIIAFELDFFL